MKTKSSIKIVKVQATVLKGAPYIPILLPTRIYSTAIFTTAPAAIETIGKEGFIYACSVALQTVIRQEKTIAADRIDRRGAEKVQASASVGKSTSKIGSENTANPADAGKASIQQSLSATEKVFFASISSLRSTAPVNAGIRDMPIEVIKAGGRLKSGMARLV